MMNTQASPFWASCGHQLQSPEPLSRIGAPLLAAMVQNSDGDCGMNTNLAQQSALSHMPDFRVLRCHGRKRVARFHLLSKT